MSPSLDEHSSVDENSSTDDLIPSDERSSLDNPDISISRAQLVWQVIVFQVKVLADGLRDVLLVPLSIISAILGLVAGGDKPDQYFRRVLLLGRRTEAWINLFGQRKHDGTSDALIEPIRERVFDKTQQSPWAQRAGDGINKTLDDVNQRLSSTNAKSPTQPKDDNDESQ